MRWLAFVAAALLAVPATARPVPLPELAGVWRGTVGTQPVQACFDWRDWREGDELAGAYYYLRHLAPIRLSVEGETLVESVGFEASGGARWQLDSLTASVLGATFVQGDRQVPIRLERIAWQASGDFSAACASAAFLAPRFAGGAWVEEAGWFDGHAIVTTNWVPPPHFARSDTQDWDTIALGGLQLAEARPGDAAINRQLAAQTTLAAAMDCMAGNILQFGTDGDWAVSILPEVLTDRWLGVLVSSSSFCGGAHPNHYQVRQVYDRDSGALVDLQDWFTSAGFATEWLDPAAEGEDRIALHTITPQLLDLIMRHWPVAEGEAEADDCRDIARDGFGWNIGLAAHGLAFMPELPHVVRACAETAVVPWAELAPFLTAQAQQAGAEIADR